MERKKLSVLVAENNEMDAKVLRIQLEQWFKLEHFDVVKDESAYRKALENKEIYDIIISDYRISGFSGLLALDIRNELCKDKPFIIYTSSKNEVSAIETIHRGADNYILKSHSRNLLNVINKAISDKKNEKVNEIIRDASVVALTLGPDTTLYDFIYNKINELLYAKSMYIALYDKFYRGYRFLLYYDEKDDKERFTGKDTDKSFTEYVRKSGKILYANRKKQEELVKSGAIELVGSMANEWLGIPLKVKDEVIGVLAIQNHGEQEIYTKDDIERLEKLAPTLALIIARNITDQEIEKKTRALDYSPVITLITDAEGRIEYINPTFEKVTGYKVAPLLGRKLSVFDTEEDSGGFYRRIEQAIKNKTSMTGEFLSHRKNGERFWVSVNMSPVKNKYGEVENFIIISEDITKDKIKSKELWEMLKRVRESDRLKSSFLANLSHEVRTPLNHILGFSELLMTDDLTAEEKKEYKNVIQTAGQRLLLFITNAVELSKIESDTFEVHRKKFNPISLLSRLHAEYKEYIEQLSKKGVMLAFLYSKDIPKNCYSDERAVELIVRNLLDNAVKFTHQGSISLRIDYKTDTDGKAWFEISVSDTGIGMNKEEMEVIFKPFRQIDDSLTRSFEGAGLGLPVSKEVAELLGGEIIVKSQPGKGSVFTLGIPDFDSESFLNDNNTDVENSILKNLNNLLSSRLKGEKIVYCGSENTSYRKLKNWCRKLNLNLVRVSDSNELFQKMSKAGRVDVVFLYQKLNPVELVGTIKQVKNLYPGTKVVVIMKHSLSIDKNVVLTAGADDVLIRPLDINEFKMLCFDYFLYSNK